VSNGAVPDIPFIFLRGSCGAVLFSRTAPPGASVSEKREVRGGIEEMTKCKEMSKKRM